MRSNIRRMSLCFLSLPLAGQSINPVTFPHKPVLFFNDSIEALRKAPFLGSGPSNRLYDMLTEIKFDMPSKLDGILPERLLRERFKQFNLITAPSCLGIVPVKKFPLRSRYSRG
ncbi:hypothetical protein V8G54_020048 [Vigna mungo]|uniref:Uncharacterized protein n=1 Tax=Vigna mungo TaxID=3915 RepID=A0AAQ3NBI3_VIGMU